MHHALKRIDAKTFLAHFSSNGHLLEAVLIRMIPKDLYDLSNLCKDHVRRGTGSYEKGKKYDDRDVRFYHDENLWKNLWISLRNRFLMRLRTSIGASAQGFSQYDFSSPTTDGGGGGDVLSEDKIVEEIYANKRCTSLEEYFLRCTELLYRSKRLVKIFDRLGPELLNEPRLINMLLSRGNLPDLPLLEWGKRGILPIDWGFCYAKGLPERDPYEGEDRGVRRLFPYLDYDRNDYGNVDRSEFSPGRDELVSGYDVQNACAMLETTFLKWNRGTATRDVRRGKKRKRLSADAVNGTSCKKPRTLNRVKDASLWGLDLDKTLSDGFCMSEAGQFFTNLFLRAVLALCDARCNVSKDAFFLRLKIRKKKKQIRPSGVIDLDGDNPFDTFPPCGKDEKSGGDDDDETDDDGYRYCVYDVRYNVLFASASLFFKYHAYNFKGSEDEDQPKRDGDDDNDENSSNVFKEYEGKRSCIREVTNAAIEKGFSLVERAAVEKCVNMRLRRTVDKDDVRSKREVLFHGFFERPLKTLRRSEDLEKINLSFLPFFIETEEDLLLSTETRMRELKRLSHQHRLSRLARGIEGVESPLPSSFVSGNRLALEYVVRTTRALPKICRTRIRSLEILKAIEREIIRHLARLSKLEPNEVESVLREEKVSKLRAVDFFGDDPNATMDEDSRREEDARIMASMTTGDVETLKNCVFFCDEFYSFQNKPQDTIFYENFSARSNVNTV